MAAAFTVQLLTAEKTALETQAVYLQAPGSEGFLGVLAHHAPLITQLRPGPLTIEHPDGRREIFAISGGFLEISRDRVIVLADALEPAAEIDTVRAAEARDRARRRLQERGQGLDVARAEAALTRALNRLGVAARPEARSEARSASRSGSPSGTH